MAQTTDTDIRDIKDLIAANTKAIADLTLEMRVGFERVDGKLDGINGRLVAVETNMKSLDGRLWGFAASLFGLVATALLGIFVRYLFTHDSII